MSHLEVWPSRAQFRPGEPVALRIAAEGTPDAIVVRARCREGSRVVADVECEVALDSSGRGELILDGTLSACERAGYAIEVLAQGARATTAFDIAPHWSHAPRYGFVSDFSPSEDLAETKRRADALTRLHLNVVQCYDWMASHHTFLPVEETFVDPLGRRLSHATLRRLLDRCRERGIAALAYGALYGAERDFSLEHPDWLLYDTGHAPLHLADRFYLQDPSRGSPWRDWILRQYELALREFDFDGIHIDQYGFPKRALSRASGEWRVVDLAPVFADFVEEACARARALRPGGGTIFNCVNGWPLDEMPIVSSDAATYIEVWEPHTTYRDLYELARRARRLRPGKPVILAAYLAPFAATPRAAGALTAFRLAFATIHASGATQLVAGESGALLTEGYYPRYARLDAREAEVVRRAFDFVVRNGPLLFDLPAEDLAWTHVGPTNGVITLAHEALATYGAGPHPGALWMVLRGTPAVSCVQLVNLRGIDDDRWNVVHERAPAPLDGIEVRARVVGEIAGVWWDTPDDDVGHARSVPYEVKGGELRFRIPRLDVWALAWWNVR